MLEEPPVLVAGIDAIARALGVSSALVKKSLMPLPEFPARRISKNGPWVSTRPQLSAWAERYLTALRNRAN